MAWNSRGLRGSMLEEMINLTNEKYRECGLALVQKVPTPITPIQIDKHSRHITLAYFDQKSTVDYIGAIQGIPVCFDAKECAADTFALANVHAHQIRFMQEFEGQDGVAFLIIYYSAGIKSSKSREADVLYIFLKPPVTSAEILCFKNNFAVSSKNSSLTGQAVLYAGGL